MKTREYFVWVEKYRPLTMTDCILPTGILATMQGILSSKDTPNLILTGPPGTGKTTIAKALAHDLDMDVMVINASDENGIDVLRTKLKDYASSLSFEDKRKMIILDEADYLNPQSIQPALRGFIEEFAKTTTFVFTCNHSNRIIEALHSRCSVVNFIIPKAEKQDVMMRYTKRIFEILTAEKITFDKALVVEVVKQYFPDFRRMLNELQRFSSTGTLSTEILSQISDKDVAVLMKSITTADFTATRKWIAEHEDIAPSAFYRMLSEQLPKVLKPADLPQIVITLADYDYRSAFAADKSLNLLACCTEIMGAVGVPNGK